MESISLRTGRLDENYRTAEIEEVVDVIEINENRLKEKQCRFSKSKP